MATTFTAFCGNVQEIVNDTTATMLARIVRWANEYHSLICSRQKWRWIEKVSDATTITTALHPFDIATLKVAAATTPADKILDVVDMTFTPNQSLWEATDAEIRSSWADYPTNTGIPEYWYIENAKLKLFPWPDVTGRSYTVRYRIAPITYASGSDLPLAIPDKFVPVLENAVVGKTLLWLDDSRAQAFFALYQNGLKDMEHDNSETEPIVCDRNTPKRTTRLPRLSLDA